MFPDGTFLPLEWHFSVQYNWYSFAEACDRGKSVIRWTDKEIPDPD